MVTINSYYHAVSSVKKWGGTTDDYIDVHEFIDSSKKIIGDVRHRSLYHHTEGVWLCQRIFGRVITLEGGRAVPVRLIAERHIQEDLGWLPSPKDYIDGMVLKQWMGGAVKTEHSLTEIFPKQQYLDKPLNQKTEQQESAESGPRDLNDLFDAFFGKGDNYK